ncbi:iron-containing alcohol dehydrogenase [Epithele typhae]|uniref:iron-containing alcohol dehydrogenase n=1 Tax=Epithele typhae TaxID=378194 RepID=UPI00200766D7|nr:iron-containing alcohol dehydrogenase [Epithele typhae]KAH9940441.1 iron-containing alcohol dehydrogenase [Epithele typhae]
MASDLTGSYAYSDSLKGIHFGPGSTATALPKLLDALGAKKALIVTGRSLFTKTDVVKTVEGILKAHDAYGATFYEIGEHAPVAGIRRGVQAFKDAGADVIVSVGGGSPVDAAKAILHFVQQESGAPAPFKQIAIPTTLSAAEYTMGAGFTDDSGNKVAVASPSLVPAGIILDAQLTLATPERLWLSTGLRALDHAVESLYRPGVPPPLKHLCYAALADLFTYLPLSKAHPEDVSTRQKLQIASWMSIWPMQLEKFVAFGLSHGLGHRLGARYGIPHGITSCLTLAPVVAAKVELGSPQDKEWLANALFYLRKPSTGSVDGDVLELSKSIQQLVNDLGLHSTLSQYNVPKEDVQQIAELAVGKKEDPAFVKTVAILEALYE